MPAKKKSSKKEHPFIEGLEKVASNFFFGLFKDFFNNFLDNLKFKILETEKRILIFIESFFLFLFGIIFLFVAFIMLLHQYLNISYGWCFFIIAIIMIVFSFIIKNKK